MCPFTERLLKEIAQYCGMLFVRRFWRRCVSLTKADLASTLQMTEQPKTLTRTKTKRASTIETLENGETIVTTADGSKYSGGWKDDKFHGKGEFRGADGLHYIGMCDD